MSSPTTFTEAEVNILFRALDALEKEAGQEKMAGMLLKGLLFDRLDEEAKLRIEFEEQERETKRQRETMALKRQTALIRAKLVEMEVPSGQKR